MMYSGIVSCKCQLRPRPLKAESESRIPVPEIDRVPTGEFVRKGGKQERTGKELSKTVFQLNSIFHWIQSEFWSVSVTKSQLVYLEPPHNQVGINLPWHFLPRQLHQLKAVPREGNNCELLRASAQSSGEGSASAQ